MLPARETSAALTTDRSCRSTTYSSRPLASLALATGGAWKGVPVPSAGSRDRSGAATGGFVDVWGRKRTTTRFGVASHRATAARNDDGVTASQRRTSHSSLAGSP